MPRVRPLAAFVSFRLGGLDGVAVEAEKWARALHALGYATKRVAGEISGDPQVGDAVVPGLGLTAAEGGPDVRLLRGSLETADLVIVENLLSLPLNIPAARTLTLLLADLATGRGTRVLMHHHDLPWQREQFRHIDELPPRIPGAVHVTINELSRTALARTEIDATTIYNCFDLDAPLGNRAKARRALGIPDDDLLVVQPTRAIARKGIPRALDLTHALAELLPERPAHFWIAGDAEEGYGPTLDELVEEAQVHVLRGTTNWVADMYAASDVVAFPSSWEGFGNPVIESVWAQRPLATSHYPVLDELLGFGFRFFEVEDPATLAMHLREPGPALFEDNLAIARKHFSLPRLVEQLRSLFDAHDWPHE